MSLLYSPVATATVLGGTNSVTISGMDLNPVIPGMVINLGARDRVKGDGLIIASVSPSGSSGGTIATVGPVDNNFTSAAFVIDTRDYNGTASNYALAALSQVLNALMKLTSPLTTLFGGSRILALDKDTPSAVSRMMFAIAGRLWANIEQRTLAGRETLSIRSYPDGSTPVESITIDLASGGVDTLSNISVVAANTTVDIGSLPHRIIYINGTANISSFGSSPRKHRDVLFLSSGAVLVHSSAIQLPGGANITTGGGDRLQAYCDDSGNWIVSHYTKGSGKPTVMPNAIDVLGFTPVQQGGGSGQGANKIYIGYSGTTGPKLQVDITDFGKIWTDINTALVLTPNGYMKLPNGVIIQWGATSRAETDYRQSFNISFPNLCSTIMASVDYNPNNASFTYTVSTDGLDVNGVNLRTRYIGNGGAVAGAGNVQVRWLAIGY